LTARIFAKLLLGALFLLAVAMTAVDYLVTRVVESSYVEDLTQNLAGKGRLIARTLSDSPGERMAATSREIAREAGGRLTVIRADGQVILDSDAEPSQMENHARRPEFVEALAGRRGAAVRRSVTTGVDYLYVAIPIAGGALRLAAPLAEINRQVSALRLKMLAATAVAFLPAILIAAIFARRISKRLGAIITFAGELAKGNFRARLDSVDEGELGILGAQLKEAGEHLQRAVEQLEREHSELEKLERVRKDFVINVSHELRTPLASIQGYAETLMDGALEDHANNMRFLRIIRQNAERLASLTADLLTLSRIEMRRQDLNLAPYRSSELLDEVIDTVFPVAQKKQIRLERQFSPEADSVYCDAEAVHQILINLLDNAMKYTPDGGAITVGTRVYARATNSPCVEIFVKDTGVGIPDEDVPRLFERFYRVDKARSREMGGTGLGLAIVKHLVLAQGGEVYVESSLNQGSTFSFTLPVGTLDPAAEVHPEFTAS
jgi:two-component system, OmpR family, phosphate regulon sensor histidine kinase PhoR